MGVDESQSLGCTLKENSQFPENYQQLTILILKIVNVVVSAVRECAPVPDELCWHSLSGKFEFAMRK